ncbi:hypothetical protein F444_22767 [Phytophthora nicotianae P1976]|uniref:Uncharacterized protein n=1 Tax=Phytophthora nicotianae P1976 TaxID=1317066 RepID=A0A080YWU5_PHYNI|nr:hypothetical protein F444_22767 [Phytophthora nicotianae P1976]
MHCRTIARLVVKNCLPVNGSSLLHVVRAIDKYLTPFLGHNVFRAACEGGASRYTLSCLLQRITPNWKKAVRAAVRGNHLDLLHWMEKLQVARGPWKKDLDGALEAAAIKGHLDIVKWLYERGIELNTLWEMVESISYIERSLLYVLCSWNTLELAAEHGHLEVVQWVYTTKAEKNKKHSGSIPSLSKVAVRGLRILRLRTGIWKCCSGCNQLDF